MTITTFRRSASGRFVIDRELPALTRRALSDQRFPLEPLLEALGHPCMRQLGRLTGEHHRQVYRYRDHGLNEEQADRVACRLDLHPSNIWPEWWDRADDAPWFITAEGREVLHAARVGDARRPEGSST